ncbi:MAG: cell division protein ZapA [Candidatus Hydrogenedentota bacterium]
MTNQTIRTRIAGTVLDLPVVEDEAHTTKIANKVTERFREIEAGSPRINTQAFALQAAFSFAAELDRLSTERDEETRELVHALADLAGRLETLIQRHGDSQG